MKIVNCLIAIILIQWVGLRVFSDCKFKLIAAWTRESYKCFVDEIKKSLERKEILLLHAGMPETRSSKSNNCLCFPGEGLTFLEMLKKVQCNYLTISFKNQCEWLEMNTRLFFHIRTKNILMIRCIPKRTSVHKAI